MAEVAVARATPEVEVSPAIREFVRYDLNWLANFLHKKYGLSFDQIRKLLREMLDVSV
jgi:hypothetical protein